MKTLAIVAVIVLLAIATGNGPQLSAGVSTLGATIGKLVPSHSNGDEQDGDSGSGEP
jgi:hypothetical protein